MPLFGLFGPPNIEKLKEKGDVEGLIKALRHDDGVVRLRAQSALADLGDMVVEPLIAALEDKESSVRGGAAGALGDLRDARAVEPLIAALKDKEYWVREAAAVALRRIGGEEAKGALREYRAWEATRRKAAKEQEDKLDKLRYSGPPVSDLTQDGVIRELQKLGLSHGDADATVHAALVLASTMDRSQIEAIHFSKKPLTSKNLALKWAADCTYHGAQPRRL